MSVVTRLIRTGFAWLVGGTATMVMALVAVACAAVPGWRGASHRVARRWGRFCLWCAGCPVRTEGLDELDRSGRFVVMANHQSALDIPVLIGVLPARWSTVFWAKKSLFRVPFLGWAMTALGHMPVDRINRLSASGLVVETAGRATGAASVLVFPEETYGSDDRLLSFHRGGFVLAIKTGLPILPVGIRGTRSALPPNGRVLSPCPISVRFGAPIPTADLPISDRERLTEQTRTAVARLAGVPPESGT
jgi:1-acyl-sn-glycerol-3-phosphate acyltransferase